MRNIGVCITLPHAEITIEFLSGLYNEAKKLGYRLVCFNSSIDFNVSNSKGAESIFYNIPMKHLEALIILHGTFHNKEVFDKVIMDAKEANVPVIFAREKPDGFYSVSGEYEDALVDVINHIVEVHNAKDIFYISGRKNLDFESNTDSSRRYKILKDTLKKHGIEFDDGNVACGEYWEHPTIQIIDKLVKNHKENGKKLPDVIMCANDIMAFTTCVRLKEHGFNIPDDVIVTGFDGLQCARFSEPRLTTCYDDIGEMSQLIFKLITQILEDRVEEKHINYKFKPVFSASCGCCSDISSDKSEIVQLFRSYRMNEADEDRTNKFLYDIFRTNSVENFKELLPEYIEEGTYFLLRNDDLYKDIENIGEEYVPVGNELISISSKGYIDNYKVFSIDELYERLFKKTEDGIYIISSININDFVAGYYIENIKDVYLEGASYNRHVHAINKGLMSCVTKERNDILKKNVEESGFRDSTTGLDNQRGFHRFFETFAEKEENHHRYFAYCIFSFINHDEISENFKSEGVEKALKFIADNLKESHPGNTYIARNSTSGFVAIVPCKDSIDRERIIWSVVDKFYGNISKHNDEDPNGPQIEVSSGCVDLDPGWDGTYSSYTSSAYVELYKSRVALHENRDITKEFDLASEREAVNCLNVILNENRLTYFFQPIVDAHTGDIEAYEALMRVTGDIKLNPLELLDIARRHRQLYRVEKLTLFGILDVFANKRDEFGDRKLFVNTIPGNFLRSSDLNEFESKYKNYLDYLVMEITEDNSIDTEELLRIKALKGNERNIRVAVDDFGTGHSNVINLMQYEPQVVKIDRFLITDIHKDDNKQMFVSNIISFGRNNNIKVLAEGVETEEELRMVIDLGVDFIQGYYTAKPSGDILNEIPLNIKNVILDENRILNDKED